MLQRDETFSMPVSSALQEKLLGVYGSGGQGALWFFITFLPHDGS